MNSRAGLQFQIRKPSRAPTRGPEPGRSGADRGYGEHHGRATGHKAIEAIHEIEEVDHCRDRH